MDLTQEKINTVAAKTGCTPDEAIKALEQHDCDVIDAVISLRCGSSYSTDGNEEPQAPKTEAVTVIQNRQNGNDGGKVKKVLIWIKDFLLKNKLVVYKQGNEVITLPIIIPIILLIPAFWMMIILLIVGLFLGFRYHFEGPELGKERVNSVMDDVSATAQNIKDDVINGFNSSRQQ